MKGFFRRWHYGIKAKIVNGALVADIDTSIEPVFVRLDLSRLQAVQIEVQNKTGDYEVVFTGVGAPGAATPIAKFEVRAAAEETATSLRRALMKGERKHVFCNAFSATFGVLLALGLVIVVVGTLTAGNQQSETEKMLGQLQSKMNGMQHEGATTAPEAAPGEPMSADQFLGGNGSSDTQPQQ